MADDLLTGKTMSIEEATVSNMWEIGAIGECTDSLNLRTSRLSLRTNLVENSIVSHDPRRKGYLIALAFYAVTTIPFHDCLEQILLSFGHLF